MKIGVYGGTFDPPHMGHLEAARAAMGILGLDKMLFVPAAVPPHKVLPPEGASAEDRLAMTALMADGMTLLTGKPGCALADPLELRRQGKSYTADTLAQVRERYPNDELWLLMGTDMFLTLQTWHQPERILSLARVAAFARTESDSGEMMGIQAAFLREKYGAKIAIIQLPKITDVSSTWLRSLLQKDRPGARELLWCQVYGYLLCRGLYGLDVDLKRLDDADLRRCSWSMVKAKRIPHIRGCEGEAVKLAQRWLDQPTRA